VAYAPELATGCSTGIGAGEHDTRGDALGFAAACAALTLLRTRRRHRRHDAQRG
jgi:hypothetical protein